MVYQRCDSIPIIEHVTSDEAKLFYTVQLTHLIQSHMAGKFNNANKSCDAKSNNVVSLLLDFFGLPNYS